MDLSQVLNKNLIMLNLECTDKAQALKAMAKKLLENDCINNTEDFLRDVYYRETLGETGIGNYVAIPHGQSKSVTKTSLCIALLKNEIAWESLDGNGVKLIILFAVEDGKDFAENHLKLLAEVARKLANTDTLKKLLNASSESEIIKSLGGE